MDTLQNDTHINSTTSISVSQTNTFDVALVTMPFGPLLQPSIGLSLLKASLSELTIHTQINYFTLQFARLIGSALYSRIAEGYPSSYELTGEWLFNGALFNVSRHEVESYIENVLRIQNRKRISSHRSETNIFSDEAIEELLELRNKVDGFLDDCVTQLLQQNPRIVGFTSVFQQQVASLALAKRLRSMLPETFIVFGGANCEDIMGIEVVKQFSFVDAVVSGSGDLVFPELVDRVLNGYPISNIVGVYTRDELPEPPERWAPVVSSVIDMDQLPIPNYDDFFEQLDVSGIRDAEIDRHVRVLFETSRGCWWGEKNHCTFCGLNGANIAFRSKSEERALGELMQLHEKYGGYAISVVDNILDIEYFSHFVPELASKELDLELFYEVKANLRKEQIKLLAEAGITKLQPGIESFSSEVLSLMRKGVRGLQNIQLLKWCKEYGVTPFWNFLCGFPGESPGEYSRMAEIAPFLMHLQPPGSASIIRLDRFSPNFDFATQLGFKNVRPFPAYNYIYPIEEASIANLAYFFIFDYAETQNVETYTHELWEQVRIWKKIHKESDLFYIDKGRILIVWDLRPAAKQPLAVLTGFKRQLYLSCDTMQSTRQLLQLAKQKSNSDPETYLFAHLKPLIQNGLMLRDENLFLSLAIPFDVYSPKREVLSKLKEVMQAFIMYLVKEAGRGHQDWR